MSSAPTGEFYANELRSALEEQSFGINSFYLASETPYEATAVVKLLEGTDVNVVLNIQGYTVQSDTSREEPAFDSIENLLRAISLLYGMKCHDAWVDKLEKLEKLRDLQ